MNEFIYECIYINYIMYLYIYEYICIYVYMNLLIYVYIKMYKIKFTMYDSS